MFMTSLSKAEVKLMVVATQGVPTFVIVEPLGNFNKGPRHFEETLRSLQAMIVVTRLRYFLTKKHDMFQDG